VVSPKRGDSLIGQKRRWLGPWVISEEEPFGEGDRQRGWEGEDMTKSNGSSSERLRETLFARKRTRSTKGKDRLGCEQNTCGRRKKIYGREKSFVERDRTATKKKNLDEASYVA